MAVGNGMGIGIPMVNLGLGGAVTEPKIIAENGDFIFSEANNNLVPE